ncbi:MAG: hypothetical protein H7A47_17640, partial [Verrucomicrobiales bacterium]|nr:hypothetical protein [Verrucomicrobiales bacterium]
GHRFTFEMELVDQADDTDWNRLLDCLQSRALRLGGKSRRGYGAFEVRRILEHSYNLAAPQEFTAYTQHPAGLSETPPALVEERPASPVDALDTVTITLKLKPRGYWMFGGGEDNPPQKDDPADMAPLREERIAWNGATGSVQRNLLLLPGSAIKGAISHRVAFHCNRLAANPRFADTVAAHCGNDAQGHKDAKEAFGPITGGKNPAVRELFGHVEEREQTNRENQASRGKVLINDLFWPGEEPASQRVPHVSIDRFTGGAADGKLFSERSLWQGDDFPDLTLTILAANQVSATARQALKAALDDLVEGRLALGAGAGRGLGWFEPKPGERQPVDCSAGDEWFKQGPAPATPEAHAAA